MASTTAPGGWAAPPTATRNWSPPGSPLIAQLQRTADELAKAAGSLREDLGEDGSLRQDADQALRDVSRASRAVRELAELLNRHPDALLRGRPADPVAPDKTLKPGPPTTAP